MLQTKARALLMQDKCSLKKLSQTHRPKIILVTFYQKHFCMFYQKASKQ